MSKTVLVCRQCGYRAAQWVGRCPSCACWDSFGETGAADITAAVPICDIDPEARPRRHSGISEFDRALGGGLVAGSVVLISGEPGVGKSTLTIQAARGYEQSGLKVVVVCGEESLEQVASRARRLGGLRSTRLLPATDLPSVTGVVAEADVVIVDSIQTVEDPGHQGEAGAVGQVRHCAYEIGRVARLTGAGVFLVGHVTKEGSAAGPRMLEHLVDAHLFFEGDRAHGLRTVRALKNRFGPTSEIGVFEMDGRGLREVPDASRLFLGDRRERVAGSAVGCTLEGRRALAIEVQSLVVEKSPVPRRLANGIDATRLPVIAAVMHQRAGIPLLGSDVYCSVAGGLRAHDPGVDLAVALSLAGAALRRAIPSDVAAVGEVGLGGEVRGVMGCESRLQELSHLHFRRVLLPATTVPHSVPEGLEVVPVGKLSEAWSYLEELE